MFKNLRTGTMLIVLCAMFIVSVAATTYSLIAEKQIAIQFAQKELAGSRYLLKLREAYGSVLARRPFRQSDVPASAPADAVLKSLSTAQTEFAGKFQTEEISRRLLDSMRRFFSRGEKGEYSYAAAADAIATVRRLAHRVADDSNLTLDPDLDSYHLQDIVTRKLPEFLSQLAELQAISGGATEDAVTADPKTRLQILGGLLTAILDETEDNLASVYRGNPDASLRRALDGPFSAVMHDTSVYLGGLNRIVADSAARAAADQRYADVLRGALSAWETAQARLDALLRKRIASLTNRMYLTLAIVGGLAALSIIVAVLTYRHTVLPLRRLEFVASEVRKTKNYGLRVDYESKNEIGKLSEAFDDMLSVLASTRERERSEQTELARVARLTSMGAMTVAIAHEINQPLAAIVANSSAAQRWLANAPPNLDEARGILKSIVRDGNRASEIIGSVRSMFQKEDRPRTTIAVNDVIQEILIFVNGEVRKQRVAVRSSLHKDLPTIVGDRVQLQQVFMNLIMNAVDAMSDVSGRNRILSITSQPDGPGTVQVTVQDSGTGIKPEDVERIFDAFYTTKSEGMGMGLFICRTIIESHGGRLWAESCTPHGSAFNVTLPSVH